MAAQAGVATSYDASTCTGARPSARSSQSRLKPSPGERPWGSCPGGSEGSAWEPIKRGAWASMGTRSDVVEGKGNRVALCSAPHGAGREYSRSRARKTFTFEQLEEAMVGIEYRRT